MVPMNVPYPGKVFRTVLPSKAAGSRAAGRLPVEEGMVEEKKEAVTEEADVHYQPVLERFLKNPETT